MRMFICVPTKNNEDCEKGCCSQPVAVTLIRLISYWKSLPLCFSVRLSV